MIPTSLFDRLRQTAEFTRLTDAAARLANEQSISLTGVNGSLLAIIASRIFASTGRTLVLITAEDDSAEKLRDDCGSLGNETSVRHFGTRPTHQAQALDLTSSIAQIETLKTLSTGGAWLIVASARSIAEGVPPPARLAASTIELKTAADTNFQHLLTRLEELGFERKDFVEGYGDFAVRGGILDVFPYVGEHPVRLEFWGDTIESIREFDLLSQRSIRPLSSVAIVPSFGQSQPAATDDQPAPPSFTASIFDYLHESAIILLDEPSSIERELTEAIRDGARDLRSYEDITGRITQFGRVECSGFASAHAVNAESPVCHIDFDSASQPPFNGSVLHLVNYLAELSDAGYAIMLASDTKQESARLLELIEETLTRPDGEGRTDESARTPAGATPQLAVEYTTGALHSGFVLPSARLAYLTEHEIFGRIKRRGSGKRKRFKGFTQKELQQLKPGDFIVHVDHGIGTFAGLKKIDVGGVEQEVMKVLFLENDILYVNLNFVNRIQKYSSAEGHTPALSKLGAPDWDRMKSRAKKRIKDIARELIALYAKRKKEAGFSFAPDSHWQKELEASFMYEDTPDQARSTLDVKADMESPAPMDRLICGDVGFGKTEVAIRAAFKAILSGKQVAVLVPTTILAIQHYNTFRDRLAKYSVRIEQLSRFRSPKEQKRIAEDLKSGGLDMVIGTHRLISKDIGFKDLGLLIIDEEHRFGVTAKEKLRQLKATVDTLSLTATPIPRTLHFSLIGARDLSIISTPPRNRLPIQTEIVPGDASGRRVHWEVIREAILAELHRGGQVYIVHDRVQNIDAIADQVRTHVPESRVHVAHGQMAGHELEKTMIDFLERKYDVLVCTKIIESGLDIPNANTIIVNRADRFGMAELHQLRGRVGRSNVQAFAYLLTPPLSALPKPTLRRLQAVEEFTELGSGFNLAMRDLEIRGAGNLLGAEQSGFIMDMGFEMYERVMREAVDELKDEEFRDTFAGKDAEKTSAVTETVIDADVEALIPDLYVQSDAERLDLYRRLYRARSEDELTGLREELRDRFGEYPVEVEHLFGLVALRLLASQCGFPKVMLRATTMVMTLPDASVEEFYGTVNDTNSPFQGIMHGISGGVIRNVQLRERGKELSLHFTRIDGESTRKRLESARELLVLLQTAIPKKEQVVPAETPDTTRL